MVAAARFDPHGRTTSIQVVQIKPEDDYAVWLLDVILILKITPIKFLGDPQQPEKTSRILSKEDQSIKKPYPY